MPITAPEAGSERIHVAAAALVDDEERVLVGRRPEGVHQGGLWEFPGGKVEAGEGASQALCRELKEELDIIPRALRPLIQVAHDYPDRSVLLDVWRVDAWEGRPVGEEGQAIEWAPIRGLRERDFPAADAPIITALQLPSVYLITPEISAGINAQSDPKTTLYPQHGIDAFLRRLDECLGNGIQLVQLRIKELRKDAFMFMAERALSLCTRHGAKLLLNAEPETVVALGAHGVHLNSQRLMDLRQRPLDRRCWVAASCHNERELAQAQRLGVDFAVLSPVKETNSHPGAEPLGWQRFCALVRDAALPVYALGGLGTEDLGLAWRHGAQGVASVSSVWQRPERLARRQ